MYKVIGNPRTRAMRVIWMLNELGVEYTIDPLKPHDPAALAVNPSGKVPMLQDGQDYVIDSVAICQYLADKHGKLTHTAGTIARAHQDSFTQFAVDDVESTLWTAAKHTFVLPEELRMPDIKKACRYDFDRAMASFSTRLGDKQFVMGDMFTVPDLLMGHLGRWAMSMGWSLPEGNVTAYILRVCSRPAAIKAIAAASPPVKSG